ncbi:MAG: TolC family protein [Muribaculaceae bacterium]|nr:TolC family protein [Muribaculaceae bacterium]
MKTKYILPAIFMMLISTAWAQTRQSDWWAHFDDPVLDTLIYMGQNNNLDLAQAIKRVEMARQAVREAKSGYYPQISLGVGWDRARTSGYTTRATGSSMTQSYFSVGANLSWEIDLFGRITVKVKEQKGAYRASAEDYTWMCVTIAAEIADYYMQLRTLQQELIVTREHIESQEKVLKITEARKDAGLASMMDVAQAKTTFYSTQASLCNLETEVATTINAIAVLTGTYPQEMQGMLSAPAPQPNAEWTLDTDVSPELLRNRPDVREAEYEVEEYAAALGVEKKQWLPSLALTASVGTEAWRLGDLFKKESFTYAVAPQLSWTVFDGFARNAEIASAREQLMASVDNYNLTLLTAVQEVENAIVTYAQAVKYEQEIGVVLQNAQLYYTLALDRYKQGLDAFINVSDAQITLLQYANELVTARGSVLSAIIALQKTLCLGITD